MLLIKMMLTVIMPATLLYFYLALVTAKTEGYYS